MNKKELKDNIRRDAIVAGLKEDWIHKIWYFLFPVYSFEYIKLVRKMSYYCSSDNILLRGYGFFLRYIAHRKSKALGFYIPTSNFGPGLYIPHAGSITINPNAKLGANCLINANVVIGQNGGGSPTLGDNVFIGAGAVICGDIKIADNVWIGANSVVTESVLTPNVLIAGVPAKIVKKKDSNWLKEFNIE